MIKKGREMKNRASVIIRLHSIDKYLVRELLGLSAGNGQHQRIEVGSVVHLEHEFRESKKSLDWIPVEQFVAFWESDIGKLALGAALNELAKLLFDVIKNKKVKVEIDGNLVEPDYDALWEALKKKVKENESEEE